MFELETLVAFGIGAGLVALAPVLRSVLGTESSLAASVGSTGRNLTKKASKLDSMWRIKPPLRPRSLDQGWQKWAKPLATSWLRPKPN